MSAASRSEPRPTPVARPASTKIALAPGVRVRPDEIAFRADTSGGPGGQHANKRSTRVELRFDVLGSPSLSAAQKDRLREKLGPRLLADGTLRVVSARERSQLRNRRAALARLGELIAAGLRRTKPRTATRPTLASKTKRLDAKRVRSVVKGARKKPSAED
jgi:ribosome-associated protein